MLSDKSRPILVLGLIALVSVLALATGSQEKAVTGDESRAVNPAGVMPIVDEPYELSVLTDRSTRVEDYETNALTVYLEERTNIRIDWRLVPIDAVQERVSLILASNTDLPDVFLRAGLSNGMLMQYGSQGAFLPMNDLIEEYAHDFATVLEENPDLSNILTAPDGNIYSLPRISEAYNVQWGKRMWINRTWLDTLGLEMPTTTEEFYEVLKAFRDQDPNGNGKQDEIPLAGAISGWNTSPITFLMNAFVYSDGFLELRLEDGLVSAAYTTPEWRDGLRYLNRLVQEGLLDPVSFTQHGGQLRQLGMNEEAIILGAAPGGARNQFLQTGHERLAHYEVVPPLRGPDGVQLTYYNPYFALPGHFVITSAADNPAAAFRWGDYQFNEEISIWHRFGVKGEDWVEPGDGAVGINGEPALINPILPWGQMQNSHWHFPIGYVRNEIFLRQVRNDDPLDMEVTLYEAANLYKGYEPESVLPSLFFDLDESQTWGEIFGSLFPYVRESTARFILGDLDIESDWYDYLRELETIGVNQFVELHQIAYDRQFGE